MDGAQGVSQGEPVLVGGSPVAKASTGIISNLSANVFRRFHTYLIPGVVFCLVLAGDHFGGLRFHSTYLLNWLLHVGTLEIGG